MVGTLLLAWDVDLTATTDEGREGSTTMSLLKSLGCNTVPQPDCRAELLADARRLFRSVPCAARDGEAEPAAERRALAEAEATTAAAAAMTSRAEAEAVPEAAATSAATGDLLPLAADLEADAVGNVAERPAVAADPAEALANPEGNAPGKVAARLAAVAGVEVPRRLALNALLVECADVCQQHEGLSQHLSLLETAFKLTPLPKTGMISEPPFTPGRVRNDGQELRRRATEPYLELFKRLQQLWPYRSRKLTHTASPTCAQLLGVYNTVSCVHTLVPGLSISGGMPGAATTGFESLPEL